MKLYFRNLLAASAVIVAASLFLASCDFFDKIDNVTIPTDFDVKMSINLDQEGENLTHSVEKSFSIQDNQEVAKYADKIKDITIESVTYRVEEYDAEGDVILSNAKVGFSSVSAANPALEVSISGSSINLKESTSPTALDVNADQLAEIASILKNNSELKIVTSGVLSHAPVSCKIVMNVKVKVTAEAID